MQKQVFKHTDTPYTPYTMEVHGSASLNLKVQESDFLMEYKRLRSLRNLGRIFRRSLPE